MQLVVAVVCVASVVVAIWSAAAFVASHLGLIVSRLEEIAGAVKALEEKKRKG